MQIHTCIHTYTYTHIHTIPRRAQDLRQTSAGHRMNHRIPRTKIACTYTGPAGRDKTAQSSAGHPGLRHQAGLRHVRHVCLHAGTRQRVLTRHGLPDGRQHYPPPQQMHMQTHVCARVCGYMYTCTQTRIINGSAVWKQRDPHPFPPPHIHMLKHVCVRIHMYTNTHMWI